MKFAFTTCVQLGLSCMEEIYRNRACLDLALTLPDHVAVNKSGRVYLDDFCLRNKIDLVKIRNINDEQAIGAIKGHAIDWLFIIGWSQIARPAVLNAPRLGVLGMHPTLLPQGRGRAAVPWAIIKGLKSTGVTLFKLDEGVDTGPIIAQEIIPLGQEETSTELYAKVNQAHRKLIAEVWPKLESGCIEFKIQDESQATIWAGRKPEDGRITAGMSCQEADRLVRATTRPYPGAFYDLPNVRLRIWKGRALCGLAREQDVPDEYVHAPKIRFKDGIYIALEWDEETLIGN